MSYEELERLIDEGKDDDILKLLADEPEQGIDMYLALLDDAHAEQLLKLLEKVRPEAAESLSIETDENGDGDIDKVETDEDGDGDMDTKELNIESDDEVDEDDQGLVEDLDRLEHAAEKAKAWDTTMKATGHKGFEPELDTEKALIEETQRNINNALAGRFI